MAGVLESAGAQEVGLEADPHLVLYLHGGGDPRRAALELMDLMARHRVALADLSRVNRGDAGLMAYLQGLGLYARLAAYAAWGTPANNLGSAWPRGGFSLGGRKRGLGAWPRPTSSTGGGRWGGLG